MKTFEEMIAIIKAMGNDASYEVEENCIFVTIHDFDGFDDDWSEIMRDYEHPEAVAAFEEALEEGKLNLEEDEVWFDRFCVSVQYDSYDV